MTELTHIPVLPQAVLAALDFQRAPLRIIDGTLGNGGHASLLLEKYPTAELLGIDRDAAALARAGQTLERFGRRATLVRGEFAVLDQLAHRHGWHSVDAVLLDIGVSSPQLDDPARGFSWRQTGALDMRMDRDAELTASRIVNRWSAPELARVFRDYGELRSARKLAEKIAARRVEQPFATTTELADFIESVLGRSRPGQLPTPTLVFQALRMAVNDEPGQLECGLQAALNILAVGGKMAVICFHSLEDRVVKNFMREKARGCICPPGLPVCVCRHESELRILTHGVVTATADELAENRRAASAKLRAAEKLI